MADLFQFRVPASVAHLGPGFGVLGLALDLTMSIKVRKATSPGHFVERPGAAEASLDARHDSVLRGLHAAAELLQIKLPLALQIVVESEIPQASGLGSNAAAFAAGLGIAARFRNRPFDVHGALELLVRLGGDAAHGAAALHGGLTAACGLNPPSEAARFRILEQPLHPAWRFPLALPNVHLGTADNRRILPPTLPHAVTTRTIGRLAGLLHALQQGDEDLLGPCLRDEVHVPFRRRLVPGLEAAIAAGVAAGACGATIAGHGPGVVAFTLDDAAAGSIADAMADTFRAHGLDARTFVLQVHGSGALTS